MRKVFLKCFDFNFRVNQAVKALRDAKIAGSEFLSVTQLDLLIRQLPVSPKKEIRSKSKSGSSSKKDSDTATVASSRYSVSLKTGTIATNSPADSSASSISFGKFKSIIENLSQIIDKNRSEYCVMRKISQLNVLIPAFGFNS